MEKYAAIYARQSIDKKDSISIESQIDFCAREITGPSKVYKDKGFSGKNTNRPAFERLIGDIRAGMVSKLVCYRLDRISRSIIDFGAIWELLSANNVEFVSVNEKFDTTTPIGRAMLYIVMVFAQLERETTAERITDNYYERVKAGAWPGGPAPFGLAVSGHRVNGMKVLEATETIEIVKRIFARYSMDGVSLGQIAKELTEDGIPSAKRSAWDSVAVARILHNPVYAKADIEVYAYYKSIGLQIHNPPNEFDGTRACVIVGKRSANARKYTDLSDHVLALSAHSGVIPANQFVACQLKLAENRQIKNTGKGRYTWLSGLLHCSECGYSLKVQKSGATLSLVCSGRVNLHVCQSVHREDIRHIEAVVEEKIMEHLTILKSETPEAEPQDNDASKLELYHIDEKISNLVSALAEGRGVTVKYISSEIERLETRKNAILSSIAQSCIHVEDSAFLLDFKSAEFDQKKSVAKLLIASVQCSSTSIEVVWK